MKKTLFTIIGILLVLLCIVGFRQKQTGVFYYAFNEKKELTPLPTKLIVRFAGKQRLDSIKNRINTLSTGISQKWLHDNRTVVLTALTSESQNKLLNIFSKSQNVVSVHPIYTIDQNAEVGITDEFEVKFLNNISNSIIDSLNNIYQVTVVKKDFDYVLRVPPHSDALKIANTYYETGYVIYSYPNFIVWPKLHQYIPNDPYFNEQWNFYNTGQVIDDGHRGTPGADIKAPWAWEITKGNNSITIAVLDEGVTSNHPDLPNTQQVRLNGSNFADGDPNDPSPNGTSDNHGNACAGLIAASQNNNQGVTGIAPNCKIMPIKIFNADETGIPQSSLAQAITFAYKNGADVLSDSWGFDGVTDPNAWPAIVNAIDSATTNGRGGKGSVVVFSAGNTASHVVGNNGIIEFPGDVNIPGVITVGASDRYDHQADYSPTSNVNSPDNQIIDVVAPSNRAYPPAVYTAQGTTGGIQGETEEIWSLDMPGINLGYNQWPNTSPDNLYVTPGEQLPSTGTNFDAYTGRFGGTSASCAEVAGVAALILSINPNLTQQQVYNIITNTADKVGGYNYNGNGFSNELGFGRLNACSAVSQAVASIPISGPTYICSSATYSIPGLPPNATVTWSTPSNMSTFSTTSNPDNTGTVVNYNYYQASTALTATINFSGACNMPITTTKTISAIADYLYGTINQPPCYNGETISNMTMYTDGEPNFIYDYCQTIISLSADGPILCSLSSGSLGNWYFDGSSTLYLTLNGGPVSFIIASNGGGCTQRTIWFFPRSDSYVPPNYKIIPNPASNEITIVLNSNSSSGLNPKFLGGKVQAPRTGEVTFIKEVNIYDASGKLEKIQRFSGNSDRVQMDISNLSDGLYFVEISDNEHHETQKLVINR